ncbi:hypothetical protein DL765_004311 [Monosporascus sp. GIB2]|nr:hypothetical protein DL765_004311 [Monosporascus sp. GIB2]
MHYIRLLRPPTVDTSNPSDPVLSLLLIITTDLGDSFLYPDDPIMLGFRFIVDASLRAGQVLQPLDSGSPVLWEAGMRVLNVKLRFSKEALDCKASMNVYVRGKESQMIRLSETRDLLPWRGEEDGTQSQGLIADLTIEFDRGVFSASVRELACQHKRDELSRVSIAVEEDIGESIARHIWDAGLVTSALLADSCRMKRKELRIREFLPLGKENPNFLEIGCGVGILGITIASIIHWAAEQQGVALTHPTVLLTDLPEAEERARSNISRNSRYILSKTDIKYENLDWEDGRNSRFGPLVRSKYWDFVVLSDCTYNVDAFPSLVGTLTALHSLNATNCDPGTESNIAPKVILSTKPRHDSELALFELLKADGWAYNLKKSIPLPKLDGEDEVVESFTSSKRGLRRQVLGHIGVYADGIRLSRLARLAHVIQLGGVVGSWLQSLELHIRLAQFRGCPSFGQLDAGRNTPIRALSRCRPHHITLHVSPRYLGTDTYLTSVLIGIRLLGYLPNFDCIQDPRHHYFKYLVQAAYTPTKANRNHSAHPHPLTVSRIAKRKILSVTLAAAVLLFILLDICRETWTWTLFGLSGTGEGVPQQEIQGHHHKAHAVHKIIIYWQYPLLYEYSLFRINHNRDSSEASIPRHQNTAMPTPALTMPWLSKMRPILPKTETPGGSMPDRHTTPKPPRMSKETRSCIKGFCWGLLLTIFWFGSTAGVALLAQVQTAGRVPRGWSPGALAAAAAVCCAVNALCIGLFTLFVARESLARGRRTLPWLGAALGAAAALALVLAAEELRAWGNWPYVWLLVCAAWLACLGLECLTGALYLLAHGVGACLPSLSSSLTLVRDPRGSRSSNSSPSSQPPSSTPPMLHRYLPRRGSGREKARRPSLDSAGGDIGGGAVEAEAGEMV